MFQAGGRLTARYLASTLRISLRSVQLSRYTGAGVLASDIADEEKPDLSPVTVADRECEALITSRLAAAFPGGSDASGRADPGGDGGGS